MLTHLINEDILIDHPLLKNEVVVMEDSPETLHTISNFLKEVLKWTVIQCNNQDEVVEIARQKRAAFFILDNWVEDNKQEGLDALERIKLINKKTFVAILTGHVNHQNQIRLERLGGNLFIEKSSINRNIFVIANEMLKFRKKFVEIIWKEINKQQKFMENEINEQLEIIERLEHLYKNSMAKNIPTNKKNPPEHMQTANRDAYEQCKSNPEWFSEHQGRYAAFVDGEFEFSCKDRGKFFDQINNSDEYKGKQIFVAEVEQQERIIDEPTSLWLDII